MNGFERPMIFWKPRGVRLKDRVSCGVRATYVEIRNGKRRRLWANIFASMDLRRTIPGGSFMVKATV